MTCRRAVAISNGDRDNLWFQSHLTFAGNCCNPGPGGERAYATLSQAVG